MAFFVFVCPFQKLVNEVGKRLQSEAASQIPVQTKDCLDVEQSGDLSTDRRSV